MISPTPSGRRSGAPGWESVAATGPSPGWRGRPQFGHGALARIPKGPALLGCYHVSQQNTNTGKLTPKMVDAVLQRAKELIDEKA